MMVPSYHITYKSFNTDTMLVSTELKCVGKNLSIDAYNNFGIKNAALQ